LSSGFFHPTADSAARFSVGRIWTAEDDVDLGLEALRVLVTTGASIARAAS
jgi:hypothetical protein